LAKASLKTVNVSQETSCNSSDEIDSFGVILHSIQHQLYIISLVPFHYLWDPLVLSFLSCGSFMMHQLYTIGSFVLINPSKHVSLAFIDSFMLHPYQWYEIDSLDVIIHLMLYQLYISLVPCHSWWDHVVLSFNSKGSLLHQCIIFHLNPFYSFHCIECLKSLPFLLKFNNIQKPSSFMGI